MKHWANAKTTLIIMVALGGISCNAQDSFLLEVYQKLSPNFGLNRGVPLLKITKNTESQRKIAEYDPNKNSISLRYDFPKICRSFGKDSANIAAIVLSHELAHFYLRHEWCSEYAYISKENSSNISHYLKNLSSQQKTMFEIQADDVGLLATILAGYETFGVYEKWIDKIYTIEQMPTHVMGYPSKSDRKELAKLRIEKVMGLQAMYKSGYFLTLLDDFNQAIDLFNCLLNEFPSREIYNNLGVCYLRKVLAKTDRLKMPFVVYSELDAISRLQGLGLRSEVIEADSAKISLQIAKEYFQKAILIDRTYTQSYLNYAIVLLLEQNYEGSIGKLNEIIDKAPYLGEIANLKAITYFLNQQQDEALLWINASKANTNHYNATLIRSGYAFFQNKAKLSTYIDSYKIEEQTDYLPKKNIKFLQNFSKNKSCRVLTISHNNEQIRVVSPKKTYYFSLLNKQNNEFDVGISEKQHCLIISNGEVWSYFIE